MVWWRLGSGGFNTGGPGIMYGGTNQHGLPVGQGIYDMHGAGFGAAPYRDGVSSGGHLNNPTVGISDIENIEMQYPMMYLSRNHMTDSGGFGKFPRWARHAADYPVARFEESYRQLFAVSRHTGRLGFVWWLSGRDRRRQISARSRGSRGPVRVGRTIQSTRDRITMGEGVRTRPPAAQAPRCAGRQFVARSRHGR